MKAFSCRWLSAMGPKSLPVKTQEKPPNSPMASSVPSPTARRWRHNLASRLSRGYNSVSSRLPRPLGIFATPA